jgi:uncharacterized membrane protein
MDSAMLSWTTIVIVISAMLYVLPRLSRRDIFFSVTVVPGFRDSAAGRAILSGYQRGILIAALATLTLTLRSGSDLFGLGFLMLEQLAALGLFLRAHRQTLPHRAIASGAREASLQAPPRIAGVGVLLLGPYVILACAAVTLYSQWSEVPDPMPVHWDLAGNPNGWIAKTPRMLWAIIGTDFITCAIFTFALIGMLYFSRQIAASGAPAREERRFRWIGIAVLLASTYLIAMLAFMPLYPHAALSFGGVAFLFTIMIVGSLELMRRGQGGMRLAPARGDAVISDRTPDTCWKWGLIYYNPDDPALIVEKRFGIGWTINFAHRGAWIFELLILLSLLLSLGAPMLARW